MQTTVRPPTLLELLLEKQVITLDISAEVGRLQDESGKAPEVILVEMGALTEDDLAAFISDAMHVKFIKLEDVEIDREAVKHVPASVAHRHMLIPVRRSGNSLVVAFGDPGNPDAIEALKGVTDFEIIPFFARHDTLEHALFVHYGEPPAKLSESRTALYKGVSQPQLLVDDDRMSHMGKSIQINRQWNFEQYVEDPANQFALNVARSIADLNPDSGYNPFHCWGPSGCGKSHLLHAIVNHLAARAPAKRVILTSGQRFADHLFEAIRDKKLNLFRYLHRESDCLLLDDADSLLTREWAQLELVDTFQEMAKHGRVLVLASRMDLAADARCSVKFKEMLHLGIVASFGEYSLEGKLALVSRKKGGIELPQEVLSYLVHRCGDRVSDLLAVLQEVSVLAINGGREITHEVIEDFIRICDVQPISAESPVVESVPKKPESVSGGRHAKKAAR